MIFHGKQVEKALNFVDSALEALDRRMEKVETILIVRDPGSAAAGEAYDGLRRQIVASATERLGHLTQLVQFDAAVRHGATPEDLAKLIAGWFEQAGLDRIVDPSHPKAALFFNVVEDRGGDLEVLEPAYVDAGSGRIIRQGRAAGKAPALAARRSGADMAGPPPGEPDAPQAEPPGPVESAARAKEGA